MNIAGLILLGTGYLLGNPAARNQVFSAVQQMAGRGVDTLNKMGGGDANVSRPVESEPKE